MRIPAGFRPPRRADSTWPQTRAVALDHVAGLPADVAYTLVRGNAIRMLGLDLD